jgi:hypothetical protein
MRGTLRAIFGSALVFAAASLLAASLAPAVCAQSAQRPARDRRAATPSSTTTPTGPTRDAQAPRAEEPGAEPDLSITARVTADSLRFEKVPDPKVEFTGKPRRDTVWQSDRQNLPQQVQPGVTYRDIGITLRITSVFADIDRIVAEALGEVPASDDARPQQSEPPARPTPTPPAAPSAQGDARPPSSAELRQPDAPPAPSPAKAFTRASARGRRERRGRGL